jgi:uncharacterized protein (DUF433 family)
MPVVDPVLHVKVDELGVAWIDESNVKVVEVITDHVAYGYSPEEIRLQHPHLSLAQIYAAFAYYHDHQEALDQEIERRYQEVEALRKQAASGPTRAELRARLGSGREQKRH